MKGFRNNPDNLLSESLEGFSLAHTDLVSFVSDGNFIRRKTLTESKVAIVSGGGSGHEPLHCGFVGVGMLDAACPGHMFTSPTPDQIAKAAAATDKGNGCIFIVKNYAGDVMNFDMAASLYGGKCGQIIVSDDVATGQNRHSRRGIAGTLVVQKIIGAAAERGMPFEGLLNTGSKINGATRSIGVALEGSFNPTLMKKSFSLHTDEIEFGVGIHGEPGVARIKMKKAQEIAQQLCAPLLDDLLKEKAKPQLLFINGLGSTPLGELYLMYGVVRQILETAGVKIARSLVGNYVTSLNMAGLSVSITSLDEELLQLWDAPVVTPSLRWGA
ncbi:MAG: dihydroxyacetone kinase subunit DhaK [Notoacmeibacter sp.]